MDLDTPVGRYDPDLPEPHNEVTLAQLLTHSAGLAAIPAVAGRTGADELGEQVYYLHRRDRFTRPGAIYSYSGPGVALAAWAMAEAYGASYPAMLDSTVFAPLGMDRTTARFPDGDALTPLLSNEGFERATFRAAPVPPESALAGPVRGLYSTVPDVATLVRALLNDGVVDGHRRLPAGVAAEALRSRATTPLGDSIGLGFTVTDWNRRRRIEIVDSTVGHRSVVSLLPTEKIGVVIAAPGPLGALDRLPEWVFSRLLRDRVRWPLPDLPDESGPYTNPANPGAIVGDYWNGGERIGLVAEGPTGLRLISGSWVLDVVRRGDAYHAVLPDGRTALRFHVVGDADGRLYMWFEGRALVRSDNG